MAKKAIAAVLLVAMHAGHMRPGHEMAADMPAEHAAHHHAEHAQMAGHSCCPGLHRAEPEAVLALTATAPACDDPHSCCFRQGPQSVPAPASDVQKLAREMASVGATTVRLLIETSRRATDNQVLAFRPLPDAFGMTLRV
jgi:hypothetical protein